MVQPQRAVSSNTSSNGFMQRGLSWLTMKDMFPQSQPQRAKHGSSGNSSIVLRIAMISCFLIILVYVIYSLSLFHILLHDAKYQRQNESHQDQPPLTRNENLRIAVDVAKNTILRQKAANQQLEQPLPVKTDKKDILVLTTKVGEIRIRLRSDLSPESVSYVRQMATTSDACVRCNIYRAEKPGILQGMIANPKISIENIPKGKCPVGFENVPNDCPSWDSKCGCHGPVMTKGMVGWAAGATGPDFFIDTYEREAKWWGTQHTVFGEVVPEDTNSFQVIQRIYNTLATHDQGGLTILKEPLKFTVTLE